MSRAQRLLQITDTHLGHDPADRPGGIDTAATLQSVVRIAAEEADVAAVLLTGDLADTPQVAAYERLRALLAPLAGPFYSVPGNHDQPEMLSAVLTGGAFRVDDGFELGRWRVLLLDSSVPGRHGGSLGAARLARLEAQLATEPGRPTLIAVHHPPVAIGCPSFDAMGLDDGPELLSLAAGCPGVRVILCGHVHRNFDTTVGGVRILAAPSTCVQFRTGAAGLEVDDAAPGYRWLDLYDDGRFETGLRRAVALPQGGGHYCGAARNST